MVLFPKISNVILVMMKCYDFSPVALLLLVMKISFSDTHMRTHTTSDLRFF